MNQQKYFSAENIKLINQRIKLLLYYIVQRYSVNHYTVIMEGVLIALIAQQVLHLLNVLCVVSAFLLREAPQHSLCYSSADSEGYT